MSISSMSKIAWDTANSAWLMARWLLVHTRFPCLTWQLSRDVGKPKLHVSHKNLNACTRIRWTLRMHQIWLSQVLMREAEQTLTI